ncbi:MAG: hypothetical protein ACRC1R_11150 [Cetobacterium sp.]|uniref:hypothetical protein n=1 Tax=Cetobacterium sp. TaxID=2071632 RepID=UPI003F330F92
MKKLIFILFLIILSFYYLFLKNHSEKNSVPNIYLKNNLIFYDDSLSKEANEQVINLYNKNKVKGLVLNSRGGEINLGIDLGEWVYDNKIDIYVKNYAFSSMANYVVPAGKNIFLYKNSMIGWHGGATQIPSNIWESFIEKILLKKYMEKTRIREEKFFNKIGVKQEITTYGQKEQFKKYENDYIGWTYSLNMLKHFGINNVILLDQEWDPPMEFEKKKIFLIE